MVHGDKVVLNICVDWVVLEVDIVNAFNNIFWIVFFQELIHMTRSQLF
jgi:hypothetical protein